MVTVNSFSRGRMARNGVPPAEVTTTPSGEAITSPWRTAPLVVWNSPPSTSTIEWRRPLGSCRVIRSPAWSDPRRTPDSAPSAGSALDRGIGPLQQRGHPLRVQLGQRTDLRSSRRAGNADPVGHRDHEGSCRVTGPGAELGVLDHHAAPSIDPQRAAGQLVRLGMRLALPYLVTG